MNIDNSGYKELEASLRRDGMSGVIVKRIMRLAGEFASLESFFTAKRSDIMKVYTQTNPKSKHGLGDSFWRQLERATRIYRGTAGDEVAVCMNKEHAVEDLKETLRMLKLDELKTIVAFMELCDVEAINVAEIVGFLDSVKLRQKKPDDANPSEKQESK